MGEEMQLLQKEEKAQGFLSAVQCISYEVTCLIPGVLDRAEFTHENMNVPDSYSVHTE